MKIAEGAKKLLVSFLCLLLAFLLLAASLPVKAAGAKLPAAAEGQGVNSVASTAGESL